MNLLVFFEKIPLLRSKGGASPLPTRSAIGKQDFQDFFNSIPANSAEDNKEKQNNPDQLENFQNWLKNTLVLAIDQSTKMGYDKLLNSNLHCLYYYYGFLDIALKQAIKPTNQQSVENLLEELIVHHRLTKEKGGELMAAELIKIKQNNSQQFDYDLAISFINDKINGLFVSVEKNVYNWGGSLTLTEQFLKHYQHFLVQILKTLRSVYELDKKQQPIKIGGGYLGTIFTSGRVDRNLFNVDQEGIVSVKNVMQKIISQAANEMKIGDSDMPEIVFYNLGIIL